MTDTAANTLYYGNNLDILRRYLDDRSVDLIYLDPPFNSNADYNVLFAEKDGTQAHAQITAFEDTWTWDLEAAQEYAEVLRSGHDRVAKCLKGIHDFLGGSDMMAYLSMMALRLIELRRVLKPTGSIYLHCDPTASHYLKFVMDAVFGPEQFSSELIWRRSGAHSDAKQGRKNYGHIHDTILFYKKSETATWNTLHTEYDEAYVSRDYKLVEEGTGRHFRRDNLTAARPGGDTFYEWRVKKHDGVRERWVADLGDEYLNPQEGWEYKGVRPYNGRYWAYSRENMRQFAREGRLRHTFDGMPEYKRYLDEMPGVALQDLWTDISPIIAGTAERLGYPTQKPESLLERIVGSSSNEGDVVLDPFCGCGTAIAAAQKLNRRWIGIDITHLAINLIKVRLADTFGPKIAETYKVIGEPKDLESARALAAADKYQFQYWALGLVGARPMEDKKGADKGIDGRLYLTDAAGETRSIMISVKGGHVTSSQVRDLRGVVEREEAAIGVFLTLEEPTAPMRTEAAEAGFFQTKSVSGSKHPRLQILTIEELLAGKKIDMPAAQDIRSFKQAPKAKAKKKEDAALF